VDLVFGSGIGLHLTAPGLSVSLSMSDMAELGDVCTLGKSIGFEDFIVGVLFKLFSLSGDWLNLREDFDDAAAVKGPVFDLSLEWEALDFFKVEILHLKELANRFESILKSEVSIFIDVS